ncbi:D-alanyl-D-alanine carboxypeptidase [Protaetiibacter sp. SSC-01]|uniref:D-alanyl-D-alanine carboxypeptidase family protein n=1 Tax=Protaetiibacter sp. SSC-01 TaxID=2759943 RepID=UPI0016572ACB|nr:D-alanyl-D-alanine carboxypeptidase [Protaetiibacter sp. SSC-01]QNO38725.1 D-alanyl-D-alanine carboxypeptidase [Protaetiibacter sp. SSC-01]
MPLTRRQVYRRRRIAVFGGLFAVLGGIAYLPLTLLAPVAETDAVVAAPQIATPAAATTSLPGYGASAIAAIGQEGVLAQAGTTAPLPMASITKVITALVVLDAHPLAPGEPGPSITMTSTDVGYYRDYLMRNGSVKPVRAGQVYSERELLELMLIPSANNYSTSLAVWAFGSVDAYLAAARTWLDAHGLPGIQVVDTSGLDEGSTATATELLRLGELALEHPVVAEIVAMPSASLSNIGAVENTNKLLGVNGIDGIKTGTLEGANLLFSATITVGSREIDLVGVVLDGPDHATINAAIRSMIEQVQAGYREVPLVAAGEVLASYETPWGDRADAVAAHDASVVVWGDTPITARVTADDIRLAEQGEEVGELVFTAGTTTVSVPLVLAQEVDDPGPWWRLGHPEIIFGMG